MKPYNWCKKYHACYDATEWVRQFNTWAEAWDACQRPDWMLWLMGEKDIGDAKTLRLFACRCVRDVWPLLTDERSRNAVEVAERFANGEASREELWTARDAALDAAEKTVEDAAENVAENAAWVALNVARAAAENVDAKQAGYLREMFGNPFRKDSK